MEPCGGQDLLGTALETRWGGGFPLQTGTEQSLSRGHREKEGPFKNCRGGGRGGAESACVLKKRSQQLLLLPTAGGCGGGGAKREGSHKKQSLIYTLPPPGQDDCLSRLPPCCCRMAWGALSPPRVPSGDQLQGPGWFQRMAS